MNNEPLSYVELQAIKERDAQEGFTLEKGAGVQTYNLVMQLWKDRHALLAEVERLRAQTLPVQPVSEWWRR